MPLYAFALGNVRIYLRIGPKTRTNRRFSKTRPDARTEAQKEDVSGETQSEKEAWPTVSLTLLTFQSTTYILVLVYFGIIYFIIVVNHY